MRKEIIYWLIWAILVVVAWIGATKTGGIDPFLSKTEGGYSSYDAGYDAGYDDGYTMGLKQGCTDCAGKSTTDVFRYKNFPETYNSHSEDW